LGPKAQGQEDIFSNCTGRKCLHAFLTCVVESNHSENPIFGRNELGQSGKNTLIRSQTVFGDPMKSFVDIPENHPASRMPMDENHDKTQAVLLELEKILESPFFRSAARSKQFLKYVVQHQVEGHSELLKERTIGSEVFLRPPGYATGDDPVVRVQAGEVRRRLDQYYQSAPNHSEVRIELPVGSYSPVFRWHSDTISAPLPSVHPPSLTAEPLKPNRRLVRLAIAGVCVALALGVGIASLTIHRVARQKSILEQFWAPVLATQQPALICLAKGVTYRPSLEVYERYSRTHPGKFQTEVERSNEPPPLDPNEKLSWSEMQLYADYGVATGDVSAAVKLSSLLGKIGKPSQVRIGANYSFEDLRNSPAVVVGAFNSKWTMRLTSNLHFAFEDENGQFMIREQTAGGRVWLGHPGKTGIPDEDFAIVGRLLDSKTGQFTIIAAGLTGSGTEAAGEFASNPEILEKALRDAPSDWQTKSLEIVLQTSMTDSIAGPPHVVAAYFW
jgi:hypothetical protein